MFPAPRVRQLFVGREPVVADDLGRKPGAIELGPSISP